MEPSFTAQINRPPTPYPLVIQTQQPPILTPATTTSSLLQNLPNFASLFGFDYRLKALEDNFSELRQTNQYAEALSSIPGTVDQYLANKMQEAVDVAVQLKYDRIREESNTANQQFLESIDEGMKKIIKEQVKKEVSKITPKIEKLVTDQLESEVLVRSSKEANTSHAVAANLSELELKKILIDKMEANNSINRSDIQRQLYKALVDAYEADKILLDTYGDTVTIKRPRDGADDDQEPSATSAPRETTTTTAGTTTPTGSKTHKQSASQSALVEELDYLVQDLRAHKKSATPICSGRGKLYANLQMSLKGPADQSLKQESMMIQAEKSTTSSWMFSTTYKTTFFLHLDGLLYDGMMMFFYKFKKGDFHRLMISIEDMLLLFVQGKCDKSQQLKHVFASMSLYECLHGRVVIQPACEDLHLGVESYQKKTQPHKADTYNPSREGQGRYTPSLI
ncbi:hypothetical protein Tco_1475881 [Tanacetum coccineum]